MKLLLLIFILIKFLSIHAQEIIDEIVVTAEFKDRSIYKLPLSASIVDDQDFQNRNAQHIEDILFAIPNINYSTGASRGKFFQIRGIGERSEFSEPVN